MNAVAQALSGADASRRTKDLRGVASLEYLIEN
jgi:hypothetical protein